MALTERPQGCGPDPPTGSDRARGSLQFMLHFVVSMFLPLYFYLTSCLVPFFLT